MIPINERIGVRINDEECFYDAHAESTYKQKRNHLMRFVKQQQRAAESGTEGATSPAKGGATSPAKTTANASKPGLSASKLKEKEV